MTVGLGYDIHRLVEGRRLVLGGVEISHPTGLLGHSDGDVVLHAVIESLLGAAGLGDIGTKFPDTDPANKDISSGILLDRVVAEIRGAWEIENVDITVVAEEPKLAPHREAIVKRIAGHLGIERVSFKARTAEGLGSVGAREAIACFAVAQLRAQ